MLQIVMETEFVQEQIIVPVMWDTQGLIAQYLIVLSLQAVIHMEIVQDQMFVPAALDILEQLVAPLIVQE